MRLPYRSSPNLALQTLRGRAPKKDLAQRRVGSANGSVSRLAGSNEASIC